MLRRLFQYLFADTLEGRSPEWSRVRREHLERQPACVVCGETSAVEVHHVRPVHIFPHEELNPANLRTACRDHHYLFGHGMDWKAYNPNFDRDADRARAMIQERKYR